MPNIKPYHVIPQPSSLLTRKKPFFFISMNLHLFKYCSYFLIRVSTFKLYS